MVLFVTVGEALVTRVWLLLVVDAWREALIELLELVGDALRVVVTLPDATGE